MLCLVAPGQKLGWLTNLSYSNIWHEPWLETTSFVCNTPVNQFSAVLRVSCSSFASTFSLDLHPILSFSWLPSISSPTAQPDCSSFIAWRSLFSPQQSLHPCSVPLQLFRSWCAALDLFLWPRSWASSNVSLSPAAPLLISSSDSCLVSFSSTGALISYAAFLLCSLQLP